MWSWILVYLEYVCTFLRSRLLLIGKKTRSGVGTANFSKRLVLDQVHIL